MKLQTILEDVLAERLIIHQPSTFDLLRQYAPEKKEELDRLQRQGRATDAERRSEAVAPRANKPTNTTRLTRNDLADILHQRRPTSVEEVEWLLAHATDHNVQLSETEELELRNVAARLLADRHLGDIRMRNLNDEFIAKICGTFRTQFGDLSEAEVANLEAIRLRASKAIEQCTDHHRQRCACWKATREELYELRCQAGEGSALSLAALAIWNSVEALARDPPTKASQAVPEEPPPGLIYNWRHFKCPTYTASVLKENT